MKTNYTNKIQNICPTLAEIFTGQEISQGQRENYRSFLQLNKDKLGGFYKHTGMLHDCQVESMEINKMQFSIHLNDFAFQQLAYSLVSVSNKTGSPKKFEFPLVIHFHNISMLRFYKVNEKGKLTRIREIDFGEIKEYLYEEVISIGTGALSLGIVFWRSNRNIGKHLLCLIDCENAKVEENFQKAFHNYFGNEFDEILKDFLKKRNAKKFMADYALCYDYVKKWFSEKT